MVFNWTATKGQFLFKLKLDTFADFDTKQLERHFKNNEKCPKIYYENPGKILKIVRSGKVGTRR